MGKGLKDTCQCCGKKDTETTERAVYYWRVDLCKDCENKARKNGHIK